MEFNCQHELGLGYCLFLSTAEAEIHASNIVKKVTRDICCVFYFKIISYVAAADTSDKNQLLCK